MTQADTVILRKWFKVGSDLFFLSVPVGDNWIATNSKGEIGTFQSDGECHYDVRIPTGSGWHHICREGNERVVVALAGDSVLPYYRLRI